MTDTKHLTTNIQKRHQRFWDGMRARFGQRWATAHGFDPTAAWIAMLDRYEVREVAEALELMAQEKLQQPPSLPMFEFILGKARKKLAGVGCEEPSTLIMTYWRNVVFGSAVRNAALLNLIPYGSELGRLPGDLHSLVTAKCQELIGEAAGEEIAQERRNPLMEERISRELWALMRPHARASGEFYTGHLGGESNNQHQTS